MITYKKRNNRRLITTLVSMVVVVALSAAVLAGVKSTSRRRLADEEASEAMTQYRFAFEVNDSANGSEDFPFNSDDQDKNDVSGNGGNSVSQGNNDPESANGNTAVTPGNSSSNPGAASNSSGQNNNGNSPSSGNNTPNSSSGNNSSVRNGNSSSSPVPANEDADIRSFFAGTFYIDGYMVDASGYKTPFVMAKSGKSFLIGMNSEDMNLSLVSLGGEIYLRDESSKTYSGLSSMLMSVMGMSVDEIQQEIEEFNFSEVDLVAVNRTDTTLDGQKAVCYDYTEAQGSHFKFYLVNGEIKRIVFGDNASDDSYLDCKTFEGANAASHISLDGYSQTSLASMMMSMAS